MWEPKSRDGNLRTQSKGSVFIDRGGDGKWVIDHKQYNTPLTINKMARSLFQKRCV